MIFKRDCRSKDTSVESVLKEMAWPMVLFFCFFQFLAMFGGWFVIGLNNASKQSDLHDEIASWKKQSVVVEKQNHFWLEVAGEGSCTKCFLPAAVRDVYVTPATDAKVLSKSVQQIIDQRDELLASLPRQSASNDSLSERLYKRAELIKFGKLDLIVQAPPVKPDKTNIKMYGKWSSMSDIHAFWRSLWSPHTLWLYLLAVAAIFMGLVCIPDKTPAPGYSTVWCWFGKQRRVVQDFLRFRKRILQHPHREQIRQLTTRLRQLKSNLAKCSATDVRAGQMKKLINEYEAEIQRLMTWQPAVVKVANTPDPLDALIADSQANLEGVRQALNDPDKARLPKVPMHDVTDNGHLPKSVQANRK